VIVILQHALNAKKFLAVDHDTTFFAKVGIHNRIRNPRFALTIRMTKPVDFPIPQRIATKRSSLHRRFFVACSSFLLSPLAL